MSDANPREIELKLKALLKGKFSSLYISFNEHSGNYIDAREAIDSGDYKQAEWVSDAEKTAAIETNSIWMIQWYPETPIGFCAIAASSLLACIDALPIDQKG